MKSNRYIQSLIQNRLGISFMIAASLLVASGQLCWKVAPAPISFQIVAGFLLYSCGAFLMIISFHFGKLSVVHPVLSTSYVFGLVLGKIFLHEYISPMQYIGIVVVALGVILIGSGDKS